MSSCPYWRVVGLGVLLTMLIWLPAWAEPGEARSPRELRVCADPNNLPFSNERREGFENKIAELIGRELNATVRYTWWAQRRGFIRNTLRAKACDVVMGIPSNFELALPTKPYYRSTYVFLYRKDKGFDLRTLDDPILRQIKIGVHLVGDDYTNPPPAHALASRQIISNVVGYTIYGDYRQENPPARIIEAVAAGDLDVAIIWGPFAGYFAKRQPVAMEIVAVPPDPALPRLPFVFDIALGVRKGEAAFKAELEEILHRKQAEIHTILQEYGIPLLQAGAPSNSPG